MNIATNYLKGAICVYNECIIKELEFGCFQYY